MSHLIVAATTKEIFPLIDFLKTKKNLRSTPQEGVVSEADGVSILVTGVGVMATAYHLGVALSSKNYKSVINAGIAGSFNNNFPKCSIVLVNEDSISDFGTEELNSYKSAFDIKLLDKNSKPFVNGQLVCKSYPFFQDKLSKLPYVRAITVNRVIARKESLEYVLNCFNPAIVSMEGAAVFYACLLSEVPCLQIRAISDLVSLPIDRSTWDIPGAVAALNKQLCDLISDL